MISRTQAIALYSYIEGLGSKAQLVLNPKFPKAFSTNFVCISEEEIKKIGINESALDDYLGSFYDGKDHHYPVGGGEAGVSVYVFLKDRLRAFAHGDWRETERLRAADKDAKEIGG